MPAAASPDIGLLERGDALEWLERAFTAAGSGAGQIVALTGEAGVGKTSVLRQFAAGHDRDADVRWGACDPLATQRPLAPLVDVARGAPWLDLLERASQRSLIFDALLRDLVSSRRDSLMVIEDIHWADDATLDLLTYLRRRLFSARVLVVVSYRDDEVGSSHPLRAALADLVEGARQRFRLRPLSPGAVGQLAIGSAIDPLELHRVTGGNPFFVTETLAEPGATVPASVRDAVLARVRHLPHAARRALEAVAIVPGGAEIRLVEALADVTVADLDECVERGILRVNGSSLAFRHELARLAWLDTVSPVHLQRLHDRALHMLRTDEIVTVDNARLAHHACAAQDTAAIVQYAGAAAADAAALGAHREAAQQYATALAHAHLLPVMDNAEMCDRFSYECYLTGQIDAAIAARSSALALWRGMGEWRQAGNALRWLSRFNWVAGHGKAAGEFAAQAIEALEHFPGSADLAMAYSNRSQLAMLEGDADGAVVWGNRAIALAEEQQADDVLSHALNNVGTVLLDSGEPQGLPFLERRLALALQHGLAEHAARAYTNISSSLVKLHRFDEAAAQLRQGLDYCLDHDLDTWRVYMTGSMARERFDRGAWDEAIELALWVLHRPGVAPISAVSAMAVVARLRARRGDPEVWSMLDRALALATDTGEVQRLAPVVAARAEAAFLAGAPSRAAGELASTLELTRGRDPWSAGELSLWARRAGLADAGPTEIAACAEPYRLHLQGDVAAAVAMWEALGCPYDAADCAADSDDPVTVSAAYDTLIGLGASARADQVADTLRAMGQSVRRGPRSSTRRNPEGLTDRELEVARLLAEGRTDAEIAVALVISRKTTSHHVSHILTKLGARNRSEATAIVVRRRM